MRKKLIIVANRSPITILKKKNKLNYKLSTGGLTTALSSIHDKYSSFWIGWSGIILKKFKKHEIKAIKHYFSSQNCYPIFLDRREIDEYYQGFCNNTIWPLFHYFPSYAEYKKSNWDYYLKVNQHFSEVIINVYKPDDIIWIQDYHLMLVPNLVRQKIPDASIGFFLHIPFPSSEIFNLLPWKKEILEGLLGADLIGFHIYDYVRHFLNSIRRVLGHENTFGQIITNDRVIKTDAFPLGIDYYKFHNCANDQNVKDEMTKISSELQNRKIILSMDRLDYSKGIVERLLAYDFFLKNNPKYRNKVTFILLVNPSRVGIKNYDQLKKKVDEIVGRINGKFGSIDWMPIKYIYRFVPYNTLFALYTLSDIALITPLRDGMNLVAKEYLASKKDGRGVLILSEMTGAFRELGEAIIVNPNDMEEISNAIKEALTLSDEDQIKRNRPMQLRLKRYDIFRWINDYMEGLTQIKKEQKNLYVTNFYEDEKKMIFKQYKISKKRIIFLDYDGTLVSIKPTPELAKPDKTLLGILNTLSKDPKNELYIISGRDKNTLELWFKNLTIGLIAEHGAWIREKNGNWETIQPLDNDWKEEIRAKLELFVDRTPGSFIEEKEYSLAWHFRKAEHELATLRSKELKDALYSLTANLNLNILEGKKVLEIRNSIINKGIAVLKKINNEHWDFILAIGDDHTDEDVFAVLPENAISIKVSLKPSKAKFNIGSVSSVRKLLYRLSTQ
ncbi:MAG: bifunctional alpha,alpha-trehalose-phosphate synthase (UDP-forming)/trehalose-phosphatase [Candidatus Helarchaeota archaeon]